jgi:hypothetical protein
MAAETDKSERGAFTFSLRELALTGTTQDKSAFGTDQTSDIYPIRHSEGLRCDRPP